MRGISKKKTKENGKLKKEISTIIALLLVLAFASALPIPVKANPISPPAVEMYEEYIDVEIFTTNETVYAKVHGVYLFSENEFGSLPMLYPLPPDSTDVKVFVNGNKTKWEYNDTTYSTYLGDFSMINWTIVPAPKQFTLEVEYCHQIPKLDRNFAYLYSMSARGYVPWHYGKTTAYISVTVDFPDVFNPNTYMVSYSGVNWIRNPVGHETSKKNTTLIIETKRTAKYFGEDFLLIFQRGDIYVPKDYPTIQNAINAAAEKDIIFIESGIYNECLTINKTIWLSGQDRETTIIAGKGKPGELIISLSADNVCLNSFTILNSFRAVEIVSNNIIVRDINLTDCLYGIDTGDYCSNNTIADCSLSLGISYGYGISIGGSGNSVINNNISGKINRETLGITEWGQENIISQNRVSNCTKGITLGGTRSLATNNDVSSCDTGMRIFSTDGKILNNLVTYNNWGIWLNDDNNLISGNAIMHNTRGIFFSECENNTICSNNINKNEQGIYLDISVNQSSIYHNNFIDNKEACFYKGISCSGQKWDNGYPAGGNYWSDYNSSDVYNGPDQDKLGGDNIGDTPYATGGGEKDGYPLMMPELQSMVNYLNIIVSRQGDTIDSLQSQINDLKIWKSNTTLWMNLLEQIVDQLENKITETESDLNEFKQANALEQERNQKNMYGIIIISAAISILVGLAVTLATKKREQ
jgi:parallel beta-helix repeat protein